MLVGADANAGHRAAVGRLGACNESSADRTKIPMPMSRLLAIAAVLASLGLAACGDDGGSPTTTGPAQGDAGAASDAAGGQDRVSGGGNGGQAAAGTEIEVAESQYGSILFGPSKQAIYLFDKENSATSQCYGACADAWPPVLTEGEPLAGDGVDAKLLGTTKRDDGTVQATYNGHPLYYYVDDPPGEVLCHNVEEFGGLWLVVDPGGEAVQ
jgi:predicted lipoprotein with Yx(FWY)xxD motif